MIDLSPDDVLALFFAHENFAKTIEEMHQNQVTEKKTHPTLKRQGVLHEIR